MKMDLLALIRMCQAMWATFQQSKLRIYMPKPMEKSLKTVAKAATTKVSNSPTMSSTSQPPRKPMSTRKQLKSNKLCRVKSAELRLLPFQMQLSTIFPTQMDDRHSRRKKSLRTRASDISYVLGSMSQSLSLIDLPLNILQYVKLGNRLILSFCCKS